jgi:predicted permease
MHAVLAQSFPVTLLVALGFLLRRSGRVREDDAHAMVRVIVGATLPALIFLSLSRTDLRRANMLAMALCGAGIPLGVHIFAILAMRVMKPKRETAGVVVISTLNSAIGLFVFPVFLAVFGKENLSLAAGFDVGNSLVATTYAYYLAAHHGPRRNWRWQQGVRKALSMPVLWADVFGIAANLGSVRLPQMAVQALEPVAAATLPLGMLAMGVFVQLRFAQWKVMLVTIGLRVGVGWAIGQLLAGSLGLTGLARTTVTLGSIAPIGLFPVAYSSLEGLDTDLAASLQSLSIVTALLLTPVVLALCC